MAYQNVTLVSAHTIIFRNYANNVLGEPTTLHNNITKYRLILLEPFTLNSRGANSENLSSMMGASLFLFLSKLYSCNPGFFILTLFCLRGICLFEMVHENSYVRENDSKRHPSSQKRSCTDNSGMHKYSQEESVSRIETGERIEFISFICIMPVLQISFNPFQITVRLKIDFL